MINFDGQIIAVSGVASGIGCAIANLFSELGGRVFGADISAEQSPGKSVMRPKFTSAMVDLTKREAAANWIAEIERSAGAAVDILVNNAGGVAGQTKTPIESVGDDQWNRIIDINLNVAFALSRACAGGMKKAGRGNIVNIGSGASQKASLTGIQSYCAAKHAVLGLTRQLAQELGPFGVRVNCIAPGFIVTNPATEAQWHALGEDGQRNFLNAIGLRRLGTPLDIANAVAVIASDYSGFINGQIISVDGGR